MAATVFNQAQLELLDMMQWVKSPEALAELKQVISDFFAKKGQEELDAMWECGEMTEEKLKSFETLHERTPYRRQLYIVTEDHHYDVLKEIPFPKVDVIKLREFMLELQTISE